jgi:hypothetical protein
MYAIAQQKVFFYGIGVLLLNQMINAMTLDRFVRKLGIYQITPGQRTTMSSAITKVRSDVVSAVRTMRYDAFLADADWEHVIQKSHLDYPYKSARSRKSQSRDQYIEITKRIDLRNIRQ